MTRKELIDLAGTVILVAVAIIMLRLYLQDRRTHAASPDRPSPLFVAAWEDHVEHGVWRGPDDPEWVVVEFMDFTCPYCAQLSIVTDSLLELYPNRLAVVTMYFPLGARQHAQDAAKLAECAREQDRFGEMYRALFASPDEIGSHPWQTYADRSRIGDLFQFERCMSRDLEEFRKIVEGRAIGQATGVVGTPTVWINGTLTAHRTVVDFIAEFDGLDVE